MRLTYSSVFGGAPFGLVPFAGMPPRTPPTIAYSTVVGGVVFGGCVLAGTTPETMPPLGFGFDVGISTPYGSAVGPDAPTVIGATPRYHLR